MTKRRQNNYEFTLQDVKRHCLDKKYFKNKNLARDYLSRRDLPQRPYRCMTCDGWHLTTQHMDRAGEIRAAIRRRAP